ncbi:type I secretion system permease/ATPase [Photobacterium sp. GB-210]|uniref:type I secretion system permease/ATPase n=1 Tax=Photobacterium sp. GB-210 TaxID=2022104 RepID=UPI000D170DAF|nr:type I secretion system permease/ATPase [Photobacterium sp. GB-210]PSV34704.1 type I secretion system permease/ATPase [Photobacterium sp. GB-210]
MISTAENKQEYWSIPASLKTTDDPLLDSLVILSEYYGNPCSGDALIAGLPLESALVTPDIFPQAAARAGLTAKLLRKLLSDITPLVLPCVLLLKDKQACILREIDQVNNLAVIQFSDNGGESEISLEELESCYTGYCFFIKKQYRGDQSVDVHQHVSYGHWLWNMIKEASPIYRDVLIASILVNVFALISPLFMMNVYDKIVPNLAFESLWVLASGAVVAFIFDFLMRHIRGYLIDLAGKKIDIVVSSRLFEKVIGIPLSKRPSSVGGMAKQLGEFDNIRDMLTSATITTLIDLPFALLFLLVIYFVAGDLAVIPLIAGLLIIGYTLLVQPKLKIAVEESNKFSALKHGHLIESLTAIEAIKSNSAEGMIQRHWQQMIAHTANWQLKVKKISNSVSYFATFITQLTAIGVVVLGVYRVSTVNISMGGIIAAVMLSSRVVSPMAQLANLLTRANQTSSSLRQLDQLMQEESEFEDKAHLISRHRMKGAIKAENVQFSYPNQKKCTIDSANFSIKPGEKIAILGKNGSGKTSLAKLLAGLYCPTEGSLRFDGIDREQIHPADLRRNIGYMPQDITLIHGTIRDNIMFGTRQVTEHQLLRAIQLSGVSSFTDSDSEGLDKQVGELGNALSRGQRQAVALAQAILNDPPILLMDEPTASMDAHAEKRFMHSMKHVAINRTLLIITHKMSLLPLVDRIIVVDNGKIVLDDQREKVLKQLQQGVSGGRNE